MEENEIKHSEEGIEWLKKNRNSFPLYVKQIDGCYYALSMKDSKLPAIVNYHACAAGIYHSVDSSLHSRMESILFQLQRSKYEEGVERAFYEWFLNFSPFSKVFVSKSIKKVMDDRIVIVDPDHPNELMFDALICIRLPWEAYYKTTTYKRTRIWYRLVQLGVHPNLAFVFAHSLTISDINNNKISLTTTIQSHTGIRPLYNGYWYDETYSRFLWDKPIIKSTKTYRELKSQPSCPEAIWLGKQNDKLVTTSLKQELKQLKVKKVNSKNVFKQEVVDDAYDFEPAMEVVAKFAKELKLECPKD